MSVPILLLAAAAGLAAASGPPPAPAVIGSIASKSPIMIDDAEAPPAAAPSWPVTAEDEIETTGPAMLRTVTNDVLTFDANSKARVATVATGRPYLYLREGGLRFNAKTGPIYLCMAGRLFVSEKSAEGTLRIGPSGAVTLRLEHGAFAEEGARPCTPSLAENFPLTPNSASDSPVGAGGALGSVSVTAGAGAAGTGVLTTGAGAASAAGAGIAGTAASVAVSAAAASAATVAGVTSVQGSSGCSSQGGCNFNPASISPSQP